MNFLTYNVFDLKENKKLYENGMYSVDTPTLIKPVKYDIDRDTVNIKERNSGYIYQFEVLMKHKRLVYIGSTKYPESREKKHIEDLEKGKHHNKSLQNLYRAEDLVKFKFSIIGTVSRDRLSTLVNQENDYLIEVASRYHNTYDSDKRKIIVVYSR